MNACWQVDVDGCSGTVPSDKVDWRELRRHVRALCMSAHTSLEPEACRVFANYLRQVGASAGWQATCMHPLQPIHVDAVIRQSFCKPVRSATCLFQLC